MTLENCIKYIEEAKNEEEKKFWEERTKRKYPEFNAPVVKEVKEEVKPKKEKKK